MDRAGARRRGKVGDQPRADSVGVRLREARLRAGLTQRELAGGRYSTGYISALETGASRPSTAALSYLADRLKVAPSSLLEDEGDGWTRLEADVLLAHGRWQEALDIYDHHLMAPSQPAGRAELLRGRAEALARLDRGREAAAAGSEAAGIFDQLGRDADAALARYWVIHGEYIQEHTAEARALLQGLLARVRAGLRIEPDFHLRLVIALAGVEGRDGEYERALGYLSEVRGLAETLDDRRRASYLFDLAHTYRETGDYEAAIRTGAAALALFSAMGRDLDTAALENDLALSFLQLGNLSRARDLVASARARFEALGDNRWLAHVAETEAQVALAGPSLDDAATLAEGAIAAAEACANEKALISALITRARVAFRRGDIASADRDHERAAELARASGSRGRFREVVRSWSEMLAASGDHRRAYELMREAMSA